MEFFDVTIIGAGAAGLFCAGLAGQQGLTVLLLDHSDKVAEKIRISGGGRANFTNREVTHHNFISQNRNFCRSALSRYTPQHFMELMAQHGIAFHEKHKGQLFCDRSAEDLVNMLLAECDKGKVTRWHGCAVKSVIKDGSEPQFTVSSSYQIECAKGSVTSSMVVVATGGLSIPKIGATDFGYRIAHQFGLKVVPPRPALVPLTFDGATWEPFAQLAGLALPVEISTASPSNPGGGGSSSGGKKARVAFTEDMLFTHRGLSGPAILQISSYWQDHGAQEGSTAATIRLNLAPGVDVATRLQAAKQTSKKRVANELAALVPNRLADAWAATDPALQKPFAEVPDRALLQLAERLNGWSITPTGTEGYKKAEVTAGGVDTRELSGQSMESRVAGLYFIGEVVDVTGWLGGYNFQWAWASAYACAQAMTAAMAAANSSVKT